MKIFNKLLLLTGLLCGALLCACGTDEPDSPNGTNDDGLFSQNNSGITINADGSTSDKNIHFTSISETSFALGSIIYEIVDSHLEIIGYEKGYALPKSIKPFAYVKVNGETYPTTKIRQDAFRALNTSGFESIEIPNTVEYIGENAFMENFNLTSVLLPRELKSIEASTFYNCTSLTSINLPPGLQEIGPRAFSSCDSLKYVRLPESLQTIKERAFSGCTSLISINLPKGLQLIEGGTFEGCSSLTSIDLPEGLKTIEENTFFGCKALCLITIPNTIQHIGVYAFWGCRKLTSITLPASLQSIGPEALSCGLDVITCMALTPPECKHPITSGYIKKLYVPKQSVELYRHDFIWGNIADPVGI